MPVQPITGIDVISTGQVEIRPEHARSTGTPLLWWLLTSRRWTPPRPINVYVIEHRNGLVLFDTGQDRASVTDPGYFPTGLAGLLYRRLARFTIGRDETLTEQLARLGHTPAEVTTVVLSHLHQDHIGGLAELPGARILIDASEWATLDGRFAELNGLLRSRIRLPGLRWEPLTLQATTDASLAPFDRAHDIFGDGTLVLLPTPGHTPGSLSLLVRQPGLPEVLLIGDLSYELDCLDHEHVPGVGNRRQLLESTRAVNRLRARYPRMVVAAAHDPGAAPALRSAVLAARRVGGVQDANG
jgi:glyoxylase-like metal-dependent hydrolase (beta-lactamase superfamily II)